MFGLKCHDVKGAGRFVLPLTFRVFSAPVDDQASMRASGVRLAQMNGNAIAWKECRYMGAGQRGKGTNPEARTVVAAVQGSDMCRGQGAT